MKDLMLTRSLLFIVILFICILVGGFASENKQGILIIVNVIFLLCVVIINCTLVILEELRKNK